LTVVGKYWTNPISHLPVLGLPISSCIWGLSKWEINSAITQLWQMDVSRFLKRTHLVRPCFYKTQIFTITAFMILSTLCYHNK
jgi:hypothetical protein